MTAREGRSINDHLRRSHAGGIAVKKSTVDHLADKMYAPKKPSAKGSKEPTADQGLSIDGQLRKKWDPKKGGLPIF